MTRSQSAVEVDRALGLVRSEVTKGRVGSFISDRSGIVTKHVRDGANPVTIEAEGLDLWPCLRRGGQDEAWDGGRRVVLDADESLVSAVDASLRQIVLDRGRAVR